MHIQRRGASCTSVGAPVRVCGPFFSGMIPRPWRLPLPPQFASKPALARPALYSFNSEHCSGAHVVVVEMRF